MLTSRTRFSRRPPSVLASTDARSPRRGGRVSASVSSTRQSASPVNGDHLVRQALGTEKHPIRLTDLGNAERLVRDHGADLRYAPTVGWLHWDGRRWAVDIDGEPLRRAKRTVRAMYSLGADIDDEQERRRLIAWAASSESEARLRSREARRD